ncbi:hypothetical protein [Pseudomonas oryzihabitans]|uniref:Uncharacterized protein n=1 Tax=Pseudomonas oryzihabitans TaxID=47885 RepID=A0ABX3ITP9_9PSED|nr:hypothetical protein [Pseudomonas psychrotolerans]ONN71693.1 hypothetical protein BVL52_08595 [Pseudomonas psychrotolerans]
MPEFKGTPGPWEIERYSDGLIQIVGDLKVLSDDEENVTTVVEEVSAANEANAQLIAAAPELLQALQECFGMAALFNRDTDAVWRSTRDKCQAAIAKALGQ